MSNRKEKSKPDRNNRQEQPAQKARHRSRFTLRIVIHRTLVVLGLLAAVSGAVCLWGYLTMIKMPGKSYAGSLPALTPDQVSLRDELIADVKTLAGDIGERNVWNYANLAAAADFIKASLAKAGYTPRRQSFNAAGKACCNIEAQIAGSAHADQIIIIGAHYDTVPGSPGANDNASAVAAVLALARRFANQSPARTLRLVFFANEEPPFFQTDEMGSLVYAKGCKQKNENIVAMLSLETIGYYTDRPNSQTYPFPFNLIYPSTGNFLGFVSDLSSRKLLRAVIASFRRHCKFPSEGSAIPQFVTGVTWSDQWSFWNQGYPAIMLTDTAPFRYPHYHLETDTPEKLDFSSLTLVVSGLQSTINTLTQLSTE